MKDRIQKERLNARKTRDTEKTSILTVLLGEIETFEKSTGKEMDEGAIVGKIKKLIESCELTNDTQQAKILKEFLPQQLTEQEIGDIISQFLADNPDAQKGDIMKFISSRYKGRFNGKVANSLAESFLKE